MGGVLSTFHHPAGLHFASKPVYFPVRNSPDSKETTRTSLRAFIEANCPSLTRDFKPAWWLYKSVAPR